MFPKLFHACTLAILASLAVSFLQPAYCDEPPPAHNNRLIDSNNPYLLLHAHNPVDWYPWGPEALERARRENKPIFLSIGYSTCYWCHVAERTLFSNPEIARLMNDWFVNIKVDREERPDIDNVYMLATQLITAGAGGWPNNVFLTPDLAPFYAGGYFAPEDDDFGRPGFPSILKSIHEQWEQEPGRLRERAQGFVTVLRQYQQKAAARSETATDPAAALDQARASILKRFDAEHGGLSSGRQATKFPESPTLELMLFDYRINRKPETLRYLTVTLDAMAYGGIYDQLGGGFHRYSTERTWSIPHFEKMLYDNAQLLSIYSQAWALTGRPQYKRVALGVRDFLRDRMMSPDGGFYTAQDAAVDGREGASYLWTRRQIVQVLGRSADDFFETYALVSLPNDEAALDADDAPGVLRMQMHSNDEAREARLAALEPARRKLLAARNERRQPPIDQKILAGLNGLATEAFVTSARTFKSRQDIDVAGRAADRLWNLAWNGASSQLRHGVYRGRAQGDGFLDDYALLIRGLLAMHAATKERIWLVRARSVGNAMVHDFLTEGSGVQRTTMSTQNLIFAPLEEGDGAYPAGISAAVDALTRLSVTTRDTRYQRVAQTIARQLSAQPERWPVAVAAINRSAPIARSASKTASLANSAPSANETAAHVRASGIARFSAEHDEIAITLKIEAGYHVNANPASYDYLIPTAVRLPGLPEAQMRYPPAKLLKPSFAPDGIKVYEGDVELVAQFAKGALAQTAALRATVDAQVCTETVCLPPSKIPVVVRVGR
jgi:uncharacterized protein YyaL (SSP411 family)